MALVLFGCDFSRWQIKKWGLWQLCFLNFVFLEETGIPVTLGVGLSNGAFFGGLSLFGGLIFGRLADTVALFCGWVEFFNFVT